MNTNFTDRDLLLAVLGEVRDAVLVTDAHLDMPGPIIVYANPAFCEMTGYTPEELEGQSPRLLQGPQTDRELMEHLRSQLDAGQAFFGETYNYRKDGTPFRMQWSVRPYPALGTPSYFIAVQRDVTARRYQRPLAIIFADVDHFKRVNDQHGHAVGDEVLRAVAQTLCEQVRDSDIVSRWGGEEFAILASETPLAEAERLCERLRESLAVYQHPGVGQITASFGVAELAVDESIAIFVKHADQALYAAKAAGRNRVECYRV
jgi:diguanylate cyclase (GGDEF)-like protein